MPVDEACAGFRTRFTSFKISSSVMFYRLTNVSYRQEHVIGLQEYGFLWQQYNTSRLNIIPLLMRCWKIDTQSQPKPVIFLLFIYMNRVYVWQITNFIFYYFRHKPPVTTSRQGTEFIRHQGCVENIPTAFIKRIYFIVGSPGIGLLHVQLQPYV